MATDLRDLLQEGAGHVAELPNFQDIYRRGRVIKWRRRASVTLVLAALVIGGASAVPDLFKRTALPPATPREVPAGTALPEGTLLPGRYTSLALGTPLTFDVGRGWMVFARSRGRISIARGFFRDGPDHYGYLNLVRVERVAIPGRAITRRAPNDALEWLADHPYLEISGSGSINVAGAEFAYVDATIRSARRTIDETCTPLDVLQRSCVPLLGPANPGDVLSLPEGDRVRIAVGQIAGLELAIAINAKEPSFTDVLRNSMELLASTHVGRP